MPPENEAAQAFGRRLREAMERRGHTSSASRSGVDVAALATAASTSYEMARRYAEGAAIPRPDKLQAIADWLGVQPGALAWGESNSAVNKGLLEQCIEAVIGAQAKTGQTLTAEQTAHIVAVLYQEAAASEMPTTPTVELMVRASARA